MADDSGRAGELTVLRNKGDATRYQILVEIASRQPAVSQQEIADAIGVTAQAVSDYLQELGERDHVRKHGRGRYEVTKEGVDWLLAQTDDLREFVEYVSEEVVGGVEVETAVAEAAIAQGDTVALTMTDGVLHATPADDAGATGEGAATPDAESERQGEEPGGATRAAGEGATAVAVTDAEAGSDVGVTDVRGILAYDPGAVTVVPVPPVSDGGSRAVPAERVEALATEVDLFAVAGTEALVAGRQLLRDPDVRFGTAEAVTEAANKGIDVLLLATTRELPRITAALREAEVSHDVLDDAG